jgi:hypothetical protein
VVNIKKAIIFLLIALFTLTFMSSCTKQIKPLKTSSKAVSSLSSSSNSLEVSLISSSSSIASSKSNVSSLIAASSSKSSSVSSQPIAVKKIVKIDSAIATGLLLYDNGDAYYFSGVIADGSNYKFKTFTKIKSNVIDICQNIYTFYVLQSNGEVYAWGALPNKGDAPTNNLSQYIITADPQLVIKDIKSISLGAFVKNNGDLYVWGDFRAFGSKDASYIITTPVCILNNVKTVSSNGSDGYAILNNSKLYSWNYSYGSFVKKKLLDNVKSINIVTISNALITNNNELYIWGAFDTINDGPRKIIDIPQKIADNVKQVSICHANSSYITNNNELYMFGSNDLQDILPTDIPIYETPVKVRDNVTKIFTYGDSVFLDTQNNFNSFGRNQDGNGSSVNPKLILGNVKDFFGYNGNIFLLTNNNELVFWKTIALDGPNAPAVGTYKININ